MIVDVEGAEFRFPDGWATVKYDDSAFCRGVFSRVHDGIGAVDVVAVEHDPILGGDARVVLIEVKDYRHPGLEAEKPSVLVEEVLRKVTATIAGLSVAARRATDLDERALSARAGKAAQVEVVLHCENPTVPIVDPSELAIKLGQRLQPIVDAVTVGRAARPGGPWSVAMPSVDA